MSCLCSTLVQILPTQEGAPQRWWTSQGARVRASAPSLLPSVLSGSIILLLNPGLENTKHSCTVSLGVFRGSVYPQVGQPTT